MPSRTRATDRVFDSLPYRWNRARLKTLFIRSSAEFCPGAWEDLFRTCYVDVPTTPYEWESYDAWAKRWNLTIEPAFRDWLRVFAWGLRRSARRHLSPLSRRFPDNFQWNRIVSGDMAASIGRGTGPRVKKHSEDQAAVDAFVWWQLCGRSWRTIREQLGERKADASIQDLVFRVAEALSFDARRDRRGRKKALLQRSGPSREQLEWVRTHQSALRLAIEMLDLDEVSYAAEATNEAVLRLVLKEWVPRESIASAAADIIRRKKAGESPARILSVMVGVRFNRSRSFGQAAMRALPQ